MAAADGYRVGVLGATGAVGSTILEVLAQRDFPAREVVPLASARSAGTRVSFNGSEVEVRAVSDEAISGLDLVLSSAGARSAPSGRRASSRQARPWSTTRAFGACTTTCPW